MTGHAAHRDANVLGYFLNLAETGRLSSERPARNVRLFPHASRARRRAARPYHLRTALGATRALRLEISSAITPAAMAVSNAFLIQGNTADRCEAEFSYP